MGLNKDYLGDSVYVEEGSFKGEVILTTDNGYPDDPRNRIVMGPAELETFFFWLRNVGIYKGERHLPVVDASTAGVPSDVATPTEKDQTDDGS
jgi:hypothetical protein